MIRLFLKKTARLLVLGAVLAVCGFNSQNVHAASSGLTISPTSSDIAVAPGGTYKGEMLVINQSELDYNYSVYATPYSVTGEDYKPYFIPTKDAVDITKWVSFDKNAGDLKVGNEDRIAFTVKVPAGTVPGSYYGTVFAETTDKGNSGVVTRKRVGMIVYLRVSGDAVEKGSVASWNVSWLQDAPLSASLRLANEGSTHYKAQIKVAVTDLFGNKKFSYERDPQVLPQKIRNVPIVWENGATFGLFKVEGEVNLLNHTEKLPTQIVFVASTPMRLLVAAMLIAFIGMLIWLGKRHVAVKK